MTRALVRNAALFVLGLLAPVWWSMLLAKSMLAMYVVLGSPAHPGHTFGWANIVIPSLLIGLVSGAVVILISKQRPICGWAIFVGSFASGLTVFAFMTDNLNQVPNAFADIGTVAFACGATLLPIFYAAKRRLG